MRLLIKKQLYEANKMEEQYTTSGSDNTIQTRSKWIEEIEEQGHNQDQIQFCDDGSYEEFDEPPEVYFDKLLSDGYFILKENYDYE